MKKISKTTKIAKKSATSAKKTSKKLVVARPKPKGAKSVPKKPAKLVKTVKTSKNAKLAKKSASVKVAKKPIVKKSVKKSTAVTKASLAKKTIALSKVKGKATKPILAKGKAKLSANVVKKVKKVTKATIGNKTSKAVIKKTVVKTPAKISVKISVKKPIKKSVGLPKTVAKSPVRPMGQKIQKPIQHTPINITPKVAAPVITTKGLLETDLNSFRDKLLQMRARLRGDVTAMTDAALNKNSLDASNDNSTMPIHMADIGSDNYEQEQTLSFMQSESGILLLVEDALERIKEGVYGICELCECQIPRVRLQAIPYVAYCFRCAEQMESR